MSGWRDADGHTAAERKTTQHEQERARRLADARHRPFSLMQGIGIAFVLILVFALVSAMI